MAFAVLFLIALCAHCDGRKVEGQKQLVVDHKFFKNLISSVFSFDKLKCIFEATVHLYKYVAYALYAFLQCGSENSEFSEVISGLQQALTTMLESHGNIVPTIVNKLKAVIKLIRLGMQLVKQCMSVLNTFMDLLTRCFWAVLKMLTCPIVETLWKLIECLNK